MFLLTQAVEEEEEYPDEEEGELGRLGRVRPNRAKEKNATLLDTIEPAELEEKMLSPADKRIQLEDRPERFQVGYCLETWERSGVVGAFF